MFASRSIKKGYDMMIGWANTVVHVSKNLDARVHPIAAEDTSASRVRFAVEKFGLLFLFRDNATPVAYRGDTFVKRFEAGYWNYTSRGVLGCRTAIYFTQENTARIYVVLVK